MLTCSVIPNDPNTEPHGEVDTGFDGAPFARIELDGSTHGHATLIVGGGLTVDEQTRYLDMLGSVCDRLARELRSEAIHAARERHA